jgi:exosome complex component RRP42
VFTHLIQKSGAEERLQDGEKHAREVYHSLNAKLKDEDLRRNEKAREKFAKR